MRYRSTLLLRKTGLGALVALFFALGTGVAQAQLPVFDGVDWLLDRGNVSFTGAPVSGIPLRTGANDFNNVANNPGHAVRKWVFPRTLDLTNGFSTTLPTVVVDNASASDPQNFQDTNNNIVRTSPGYAMQMGLNPQQMAHSYLTAGWALPLTPADQSVNDYRSPLGGFSRGNDPTQNYNFDYAYVLATHNDFAVQDPNTNTTRPASPGELAAMPYAPSYVYNAVQTALVNDPNPRSTYSTGTYNLPKGNYGIDIYSPGDGTNDVGVIRPNVNRAFVRVSWKNTVDVNGNIVKANTENPTFSRIYEVPLNQAGWIHVQGGGNALPVFPFDPANPQDQITVTIYSVTPDTYLGASDPVFGAAPVVTADAVRFVAHLAGTLALGPIAADGRILGPVVGTNKILKTVGGTPIADIQPLIFFAREEVVADPNLIIAVDPTQPISPGNPLIADPTATVTAPVFYCLDNQNGNVLGGDSDGFRRSIDQVRWRYVGTADAGNTTGTSSASPMIANVRCRDGNTRTMVYFMTTTAAQTLGHVYAFDAAGDRFAVGTRPAKTTQNYWTYPSYRPLTPAELATNKLPTEDHDPNYKNFVLGTYPAPVWGADIADPFFHYDGEIVPNPSQAGDFVVRSDTHLPLFGGMNGSPVIIDDPSNPAGGQILVIGNLNGHVYAFDAGGRGDFDPANNAVLGTTQRIWTWPHFGADAYYANNLIGTNRIANEPDLGTIASSLTYDPNYIAAGLTTKPILVPGGDGHLYAINAPHDVLVSYNPKTSTVVWQDRRNWVYPALDSSGLGGALSTVAIFQPNGAAIPYAYFTCQGRAYAVQEVPPVIAPTPPTINPLKWVYPNTPNPPFADPNDDTTAPLDPGFNGTAPVLLSQGALNASGAFAGSPAVNNDFCYVLEGNSTIIGLNAFDGTLLASGTTSTGSATSASPIATMLTGLLGDASTLVQTTNTQPAMVFADDSGAIFGLAARPDPGNVGPLGGGLLGQIWHHYEVQQSRIAAASLVNGLIIEGDEGGQLRAYGLGTGINGLGETLGSGEPVEPTLGPGALSIDMRVLDVFPKLDSVGNPVYDRMMLRVPGGKTANRKNAGGGYANSALPASGNIINGNTMYAADWGDSVYVAAAGVYHAQPRDTPGATGPPRITVVFTLTTSAGVLTSPPITVPPTTQALHGMAGEFWPDDLAILTPGEHDGLSIYGYDAASMMSSVLTGRNNNVYPWIAKYAFFINPGSNATNGAAGVINFVPGSGGYRITAIATLEQSGEPSTSVGARSVGQSDYTGLQTGFPASFATLGRPRTFAVTNPIAITTRGTTNMNDMTGAANRNVIGLFPSINAGINGNPGVRPANAGELINNGNRQNVPGFASANSAVKAIYAPFPMVPDGSTSTYSAVDNAGNRKDAFFIFDRSNLSQRGGRTLSVQILTSKAAWHGWSPSANPTVTGSSVMNPLPWEQFPNDRQDSLDYPSIPTSAFSILSPKGEDAVAGLVALNRPKYVGGLDPAVTRQLVETPFTMQLKVPLHQPANVNYGIHTFNGISFGSPYRDMSGVNRGDTTAGNAYDRHILGPLITNTGNQAALGSGPVYPAGGYIAGLTVRALPSGTPRQSSIYDPRVLYNTARGQGGAAATEAVRALDVGIAVPPGVKMRVAETTLNLGKLPHGTGYTPLTDPNNARSFQVPFAPNMTSGPGPFWDEPTLGGEFFRPFTLTNESNINLVDVRIAKLLGQNFSQIDGRTLSQYTDIRSGLENTAVAASLKFFSDQVNSQSIPPLYAVPFKNVPGAQGVGNAGVASSLDHYSSSSNPVTSLFAERAMWPFPNNFVVQADIDSANQNYGALLPTANSPANGIYGWFNGVQPQPTVGKPRVGDAQGRVATIPDQPYSGNATFPRPRIGLAIPLGTPVGTYSAPVYAFEDNTPLQWQEWLSHYSKPAGVTQNYPVPHDGILNVSPTGSPSEGYTDPGFVLTTTVRESKLTRQPTFGTLSMLDPFGIWNDPKHPELPVPPGSDIIPAVYMAPGTNANVFNRNLFMYWPTNRRQNVNDTYIDHVNRTGFPNGTGLVTSFAPYELAVSSVPAPYSAVAGTSVVIGDFDFGNVLGVTGSGAPLSAWWTLPGWPLPGFLQQHDNTTVYNLFPSTPSGTIPFLPGTANVDTMRLTNPAVAPALDFSSGYTNLNPNLQEAYLFWQGQVDKLTQANSGQFQTRDSRLHWTRLFGGFKPGVPNGPIYSMPDDPGLTKLAPKPLLVILPTANGAPAQKFLYAFWHAGNQSNASIYYNAMVTTNLGAAFTNNEWLTDGGSPAKPLGDLKLPTPGALVWQSDPAPVFRHILDPYDPLQIRMIDVIDVVFTGVLKGRQTVETLLSRYQINRNTPVNPGDPPVGSLTLLPLPQVVGEVLTRFGNTNTFQARDAAWALGTGPQGTLVTAATAANPVVDGASQISIFGIPGGLGNAPVLLNAQAAPKQTTAQLGRYDQASGLLIYDSALGGQILVDMRSGTIRFPQVAPGSADRIQVSYTPFVMRLNTSRDDSNIDRTQVANFGAIPLAPGFNPTASITSSGSNASPVVVFDRGRNPRTLLAAPQVVFPNGANPTLDRMWVLYRKSDPSGVAKSTIYYKSMRLMVKLPYPVRLSSAVLNGLPIPQQILPVSVTKVGGGAVGPYEVDFVRGRIYFTEANENSHIVVNYNFYVPGTTNFGNSGNLVYRVAWGDEISTSIQQGDQTTGETVLPTDSAVSEGQVAAFKDPFLDKLWVFWSSTRASSTDLYFESIAPQFYPTFSNQR